MSNVRSHLEALLSLVTRVRGHYVTLLLSSFAEYRALHAGSALEVMFEVQRDEPYPFRLYRSDIAANVEGENVLTEVNPPTHLRFEPFEVELESGPVVAVQPFVWNDVCLQSSTRLPFVEIEEWSLAWLDPEDERSVGGDGLQGVIHSVIREDREDGSTLLAIDFGSSPVEALEDLLDLATKAGSPHVSIYSATLL